MWRGLNGLAVCPDWLSVPWVGYWPISLVTWTHRTHQCRHMGLTTVISWDSPMWSHVTNQCDLMWLTSVISCDWPVWSHVGHQCDHIQLTSVISCGSTVWSHVTRQCYHMWLTSLIACWSPAWSEVNQCIVVGMAARVCETAGVLNVLSCQADVLGTVLSSSLLSINTETSECLVSICNQWDCRTSHICL